MNRVQRKKIDQSFQKVRGLEKAKALNMKALIEDHYFTDELFKKPPQEPKELIHRPPRPIKNSNNKFGRLIQKPRQKKKKCSSKIVVTPEGFNLLSLIGNGKDSYKIIGIINSFLDWNTQLALSSTCIFFYKALDIRWQQKFERNLLNFNLNQYQEEKEILSIRELYFGLSKIYRRHGTTYNEICKQQSLVTTTEDAVTIESQDFVECLRLNKYRDNKFGWTFYLSINREENEECVYLWQVMSDIRNATHGHVNGKYTFEGIINSAYFLNDKLFVVETYEMEDNVIKSWEFSFYSTFIYNPNEAKIEVDDFEDYFSQYFTPIYRIRYQVSPLTSTKANETYKIFEAKELSVQDFSFHYRDNRAYIFRKNSGILDVIDLIKTGSSHSIQLELKSIIHVQPIRKDSFLILTQENGLLMLDLSKFDYSNEEIKFTPTLITVVSSLPLAWDNSQKQYAYNQYRLENNEIEECIIIPQSKGSGLIDIYSLQTFQMRSLNVEKNASCWNTYGKYLMIMTGNRVIEVYHLSTLEKIYYSLTLRIDIDYKHPIQLIFDNCNLILSLVDNSGNRVIYYYFWPLLHYTGKGIRDSETLHFDFTISFDPLKSQEDAKIKLKSGNIIYQALGKTVLVNLSDARYQTDAKTHSSINFTVPSYDSKPLKENLKQSRDKFRYGVHLPREVPMITQSKLEDYYKNTNKYGFELDTEYDKQQNPKGVIWSDIEHFDKSKREKRKLAIHGIRGTHHKWNKNKYHLSHQTLKEALDLCMDLKMKKKKEARERRLGKTIV